MSEAPGVKPISVEVVFATAQRQELVALKLAAGSTVVEAIEASGLAGRFDDFLADPDRVGIFSRKVAFDQVLRDGDRVEIYRPLVADPKEARRQRALLHEKDG